MHKATAWEENSEALVFNKHLVNSFGLCVCSAVEVPSFKEETSAKCKGLQN